MVRIKLRDLRLSKGISGAKLAEITGIARSYLSELENGVLNNPTLNILYKLSKALGCSIGDLIEEVDAREHTYKKRVKKDVRNKYLQGKETFATEKKIWGREFYF